MQRSVPSLLRPHRVVLRGRYARGADSGFVGKRVVRQVAVKFKIYLRSAQSGFQRIDGVDFEELVLRGPVAHNGYSDFARVDVIERWAAVPHHTSVQFG